MLIILQDSAGEVLCYCPKGYALDANKTCQDINECETGNNLCTKTTSECNNTEGGYVEYFLLQGSPLISNSREPTKFVLIIRCSNYEFALNLKCNTIGSAGAIITCLD